MVEVLNKRLSDLLEDCIEEYIKSAVPIASGALAGRSENRLSPATIRNDLKMLEQFGYLHQVHTSGGRVPTAMGYRAYIDSTEDTTFAADLINDLQELSRLVERIDRKIHGSGAIKSLGYDQILERRQSIYRLLDTPDLEMSAFYLLIKEISDGRK